MSTTRGLQPVSGTGLVNEGEGPWASQPEKPWQNKSCFKEQVPHYPQCHIIQYVKI